MDGFVQNNGDFLRKYLEKYPLSGPRDIVKLLYQREFGGGHMINNEFSCLDFITKELDSVVFNDNTELFEDIGNGMARLNFSAAKDIPPEVIAGMFIYTANNKKGDFESFNTALTELYSSDFGTKEYIDEYIILGCPAVSHSEAYRRAYNPHYRVVYGAYKSLLPLILKAFRLLKSGKKQVVLAVEGASGTGKSTSAELIKVTLGNAFNVNIIHADHFFLPFAKKTPDRLNQIGGNIDFERLKYEVIDNIPRDLITYGVFNCKKQKIVQNQQISTDGLLILEGVYSLHPAFGRYYDYCALMTSSLETRLKRIKKREFPKIFAKFVNEWIPLEDRYLEALDPALFDFTIET